MIGILDYGVGNVQAFLNAFKFLDIDAISIQSDEYIKSCSHLILPGVGSFDYAMKKFNESGLCKVTLDHVEQNKPLLGVCVGMQMLAISSDEGSERGLGLIAGSVKKFKDDKLITPHMGWNTIIEEQGHKLLNNLGDRPEFYFLHSYYFEAAEQKHVIGSTQYSHKFSSLVYSNNVFGIQCHPEKSHISGLNFLQNFVSI